MQEHYIEEMSLILSEATSSNKELIKKVLKNYWSEKSADVWDIQDIIDSAKEEGIELTYEEAKEVLAQITITIDADCGINFDFVKSTIQFWYNKIKKAKESLGETKYELLL